MELWKRLKNTDKPIVLYGMGNGADRILDELNARGIPAAGVFASDGFVRHQPFRGFTVGSYAELKSRFGDMIVLLAFGTHRPEVMDNVKHIMGEQEVYAADIPVAGGALFDEVFLHAHLAELEQVYRMLADAQSRQTFENVIRAKLTGEIPPLFACESTVEEAWGLFRLNGQESYLDIGAYTGDTLERFIRLTNGRYVHIYAVEPDQKNFKKLLQNTENLTDITCWNCCADECAGERYFAMDGGRKSRALAGKQPIPAVTVDELMGETSVSLIKMDVEGMEAAVLRGAAGTIRRCKPSMLVSAYHRSEDLFALPLTVEQIQPGAKLYLRHLSCLPAWDTDFYFNF